MCGIARFSRLLLVSIREVQPIQVPYYMFSAIAAEVDNQTSLTLALIACCHTELRSLCTRTQHAL